MANDGEELPWHEEASGENGGEVDSDSDAVDAIAIPEPFPWRCAVGETTAGAASNVEVGEPGEGEANECSCKDDNWKC